MDWFKVKEGSISVNQLFTQMEYARKVGKTQQYINRLVRQGELLIWQSGEKKLVIDCPENTKRVTEHKKVYKKRVKQESL